LAGDLIQAASAFGRSDRPESQIASSRSPGHCGSKTLEKPESSPNSISHDFLTAFHFNTGGCVILLVEDEKKLAAFIEKGIEKKCGHAVDVIHDGEEDLFYAGAVQESSYR
jgi:hypothetical protein